MWARGFLGPRGYISALSDSLIHRAGLAGPAARAHDTASQKPMRSPGMSRNAARQPTADGRQGLARLAIPEQLVDELDRRSLAGL